MPYEYVVPVYGKRMTRYSKIMAHDETDSLRVSLHFYVCIIIADRFDVYIYVHIYISMLNQLAVMVSP